MSGEAPSATSAKIASALTVRTDAARRHDSSSALPRRSSHHEERRTTAIAIADPGRETTTYSPTIWAKAP